MEENRSREYNRQIRVRMTDRVLLKRIGITRKAMQAAFERADMKQIARQLDELLTGRREALLQEAQTVRTEAQKTAADQQPEYEQDLPAAAGVRPDPHR